MSRNWQWIRFLTKQANSRGGLFGERRGGIWSSMLPQMNKQTNKMEVSSQQPGSEQPFIEQEFVIYVATKRIAKE